MVRIAGVIAFIGDLDQAQPLPIHSTENIAQQGAELSREHPLQELGAGAGEHQAHFLTLLAEAVGHTGDYAQALAVIAAAEAQVAQSGERFYEAETWRVKGELLLVQAGKVKSQSAKVNTPQHPAPKTQEVGREAEECFLKAIAVAQRQQAKSLELRAVMSLVRFRRQQATQTGSRTTHENRRRVEHAL